MKSASWNALWPNLWQGQIMMWNWHACGISVGRYSDSRLATTTMNNILFFLFRLLLFSKKESLDIKTYLAKFKGVPKNLGVHPLPDPCQLRFSQKDWLDQQTYLVKVDWWVQLHRVWLISRLCRPFRIKQAVRYYRRCSLAGSERVLGWHSSKQPYRPNCQVWLINKLNFSKIIQKLANLKL